MGLLSGIVRAAGALVGGYMGGPAGAALGGGLATKLTGGSTKSALATGAISGLGAWGLQELGGLDGGNGTSPGGVNYDDAMGGYTAADAAAARAGPEPSMWDRASTFVSDKSNLAKLGLGGLVAAGTLGSRQPQQDSYIEPPVGSDPVVRARPMNRSRRAYGGDPYRYAESGPEWRNYEQTNPEVQTYRRGGRVRGIAHFAAGGRTYQPYTGAPGAYDAGGEHLWFGGQTQYTPPPGVDVPAAGHEQDGMFRYTPQGERGMDMGGDSRSGAEQQTGTATANTLGEFARAAMAGLSMMSPLGFTVGMLGAKNGMPGGPLDAIDTLTGYGKNQAPIENPELHGPLGSYGPPTADAAGITGAPGGFGAGPTGNPDGSYGSPGLGGDPGDSGAASGGMSGAGADPGADGGPSGPWKKGGHVRGIGSIGQPMERRHGALRGPGGGQDDLIPAYVADGEHIIDSATVADLGDGSNEEGHRKLEAMKKAIRAHKRSAPTNKIPPKAKGLSAYLKKAA